MKRVHAIVILLTMPTLIILSACNDKPTVHKPKKPPTHHSKITIEASYKEEKKEKEPDFLAAEIAPLPPIPVAPLGPAPFDVPPPVAAFDAGPGFLPPPPMPPPPPFLPVYPIVREREDDGHRCCCEREPDLGVAGFSGSGPSEWYTVDTHGFPDFSDLSINRNGGYVEGGVELNSTGLTILEPGTYFANISAILSFDEVSPDYTPLITVFLVPNGTYSPTNTTTQLAAVGSLPPGLIVTLQGSGILLNVEEDTPFSLIVANGGSPQPEPITVIAWSITVYKIFDSEGSGCSDDFEDR